LKVRIEFSGIAKSLAGKDSMDLPITPETTYRGIIRQLAGMFPEMVNLLISPSGDEFLSSVMFVIDGDLANPVMLIDQKPQDGECIHLMSVITGG